MLGIKPAVGVLLLQLGTPDSTSTSDVRSYLREFLSDPRVMDMPAPVRTLLLNAVILPFRPRRSAEQYEKIWTESGSPLLSHTNELASKVAAILGEGFSVAVGMRYKNPSIESALDSLVAAGCERIVALPLFPQYASAAGGSAAARLFEVASGRWNVPDITTVGAFYDDPGYVQAMASVAGPELAGFGADHVLFSYHGVPESQLHKSHTGGTRCDDGCTDAVGETNRNCYRAQCYATTRLVAAEIGLDGGTFSTTFQSRLKGKKWIEPYTDVELPKLHAGGVRRLAVLSPAFTADCLETLEELGIRGRNQWSGLGGEDFLLVPCVNAHDRWASAVADLVRGAV